MTHSITQLPLLQSLCSPCRQRLAQAFGIPTLQLPHKRLLTSNPHNLAEAYSADPVVPTLSRYQARESPRLTPQTPDKAHRLHIYSTKHNCRITLTRGNRDTLISVSAGNIGFRKAQRGTYDAAYQLGTFVMGRINNQGLLSPEYPGKGGPIKELEVVLRDFGPGREAVTKILMGAEGKALRSRVSRVMDSTRLKFGGTRSKKPRRLG